MLEFLRDIGKHFSVNAMMAKDSVRSRMEGSSGISFTEFSYSLLQSYDFLHLHEKHRCVLQAGGADQWGNITAGIDLIRRKTEAVACGLTTPLLTKTDGTKFGKTEGRRGVALGGAHQRLQVLPVSRPGGGCAGDPAFALLYFFGPRGYRGLWKQSTSPRPTGAWPPGDWLWN